MSKLSEQEYLLTDQYKDASNLNARLQLHRRFSTNTHGWMRWVFDRFDMPPTCQILDVGCGPANLWVENLERIPTGWDITLTDFSPGMVEQAQENLCNSRRSFTFEILDAQSIPYENACFDAVIANHMLYHVPDRAKALAEMRRVLRPGCKLYASTVGENHMRELDEMISQFDTRDDHLFAENNPFTLESGVEELGTYFSDVATRRYEDSLVVTEAEPLIAYAESMVSAQSVFAGDRLAEFAAYMKQEVAAHGAIYITKDSGIFEALCSDKERYPG